MRNILKKVIPRTFHSPIVDPVSTLGPSVYKKSHTTVIDTKLEVANYEKNTLFNSLNHHDSFCCECGQLLNALFPLSSPSPKNKHICLGCCRLFGTYSNWDSKFEIKSKLQSCDIEPVCVSHSDLFSSYGFKDLPSHRYFDTRLILEQQKVLPNCYFEDIFANTDECLQRSVRARLNMKSRFKRQNIDSKSKEKLLRELATSLEIFDLLKKSNGFCAVSGIRGRVTNASYGRLPPFFLTIDHITPISRGGSSNIDNLQILANCLNLVKGNEINSELIRWLDCFRDGRKKRKDKLGII